jgi:hypothetical protein
LRQPAPRVRVLPIVLLALGAGVLITIGVIYLFSSSHGGPPGIEPALANAPEGQLVYPGAQNVQLSGVLAECRDGLWQPALLEVAFKTSDPIEAVDRWYAQKLEPLGWRAQGPPGPSYVLERSNNDELFLIYSKDTGVVTEFQRNVKVGRC